jgi:YVTN family beta-propeller protein
VGLKPEHLAATPDGTHVYVANINSGTVSVIRTGTNTVVATVPVGNNPIGVAVTPDGKHSYVAIDSSNDVDRQARQRGGSQYPLWDGSRGVAIGP